MPDTQWLQELESAGCRYSALSTRLIAQMEQLARHGNEKDQVGRWRLTTEQVAAVRDGYLPVLGPTAWGRGLEVWMVNTSEPLYMRALHVPQ